MPTPQPTTVGFGSPVLAADLDSLLEAADYRLATLFGNRSWFAFNLAALPAHQIPLLGTVYVLTSNAARSLIPAPGALDGSGLFYWPGQYDHAGYLAQVTSDLTVEGLDAEGVAWEVSGTFAGHNGYGWGDCAGIIEWEHAGVTRPLRLQGAYEPERFHRYALADIFLDDSTVTSATWPGNKHGVIRIHNLGTQAVDVTLDDATVVSVPARGIRVLRRTSHEAAWQDASRRYFPQALSGDLPMWDAALTGWGSQTLRGQTANPIFRQAILSSMFRPTALTHTGPGLFSSTVIGVGVQPAETALLAEVVCDHGDIEVIRTSTGDATVTDRFRIMYSGTLEPAPDAWADCGLTVTLDDTERAAVVAPTAGFTPPPSGAWHYDLISRSTNLSGGIIVGVKNADVSSRVLRPWWPSAADADAWWAQMFRWDPHTPSAAMEVQVFVSNGTWSSAAWTPPSPGIPNPDTDYFGVWSASGSVEYRSYKGTWGSTAASTVAPWNLWSDTIGASLPDRAGIIDPSVVRALICTAVVLTEEADFWHTGPGGTWDQSCPISPAEGYSGVEYVLHHDGQALGLGSETGSGHWREPRWRLYLLPTIGADPQQSWEAIASLSAEEIIWTPLHRESSGAGTICHWRTTAAEGAAGGAGWAWNYGTTTSHDLTDPNAPSAAIRSGMSFWRVFWMGTRQPGESDTYPGQPRTGPHPWPVRDHGWLADRVLAGEDTYGDTWYQARESLYDDAAITGISGGDIRPEEYHVGMQIRMGWRIHNQLAALISGITHCRPLGWEHYVDGFGWEDLAAAGGWSTGTTLGGDRAVAQATEEMHLQPFGAVHIYGINSAMDAKLDALGITRRSSECPELQALASVTCKQWASSATGYTLQTFSRPSSWSSMGGSIEWCSADDIADALADLGWEFDGAWLVQPVRLETLVPDASMETVVDTIAGVQWDIPWTDWHVRRRLERTAIVYLPDDGATPAYQIRSASQPWRSRLAVNRPRRSQILTRVTPGATLVDPYSVSIIRVTLDEDVLDALDRASAWGEFAVTSLGPQPDPTACWSLTLLGPAGLTGIRAVCVPTRRLLWDWSADETGPRSMLDASQPYSVACELPDTTPRVEWRSMEPGDTLSASDLAGASPAWPDDHHTWDILLTRRRGLAAF